jgi:hypothetical protein
LRSAELDSEDRQVTLGAEFWLMQAGRGEGFAMPEEPLSDWRPRDKRFLACLCEPALPVIFGSASQDVDLPVDIFGSAFWMLARIEELASPVADAHDRFPGSAALAVRADFVERPLVDEYIALLRTCLALRFPGLSMRETQFRLLLSHDVDSPSEFGVGLLLPWLRGVLRQALGTGDRRALALALRRVWHGVPEIEPEDPHNTFAYLMDQSERRGLRSAFYFFGGRTDWRRDAGYLVSHPAMGALMRQVHERGHELGLHPSYGTYLSPQALAREASVLRDRCAELGIQQKEWGGRMHFLRWRWPETAVAWVQAGLAYDSTLGFADRAGFRCGTSREYLAFDPLQRSVLPLRIRPLVAMECSVISARYMGLGYGQSAVDTFFRLKERCRAYGGNFSLLWHNSHFTQPEDREVYESVLDY